MDKFKRMQTFVRIVEGGSLTAAANALEVSQPSVVRLLAALEADLGVRLINRTTRRMALTDEGREYYERCRAILGVVDEAEAQLKSRRAEPRGRLRLTAPVLFGRLFIAPVVNEFLARHAAVQVELLLLDRVVDLLEEGIDAAVRLARLADSSLVAVPLGAVRRVTVGSPALIRRRGRPARAEDLAGAPVVSFTGLGPADEWSFERAGRALRVKVAPVFVSNQIDAALAAGEAGLGWGRFLSYQVAARRQAQARAGRRRRYAAARADRLSARAAALGQLACLGRLRRAAPAQATGRAGLRGCEEIVASGPRSARGAHPYKSVRRAPQGRDWAA